MNQICVSLDLETTGLKPEYDQIIEIGAIKFCGEEILDSFHTLVNPYRSLSYHICWLTGITQEELETAPPLAAVAGDLISFVGERIARHKKPQYVEFVEEIPLLADGSIDRKTIKARYGGKQL